MGARGTSMPHTQVNNTQANGPVDLGNAARNVTNNNFGLNVNAAQARIVNRGSGIVGTGSAANQQILETGVQGSNPNLAGQNVTQVGPGGTPGGTSSIRVMGNVLPENLHRLHQSEDDERYRYLLTNGIVRSIEDENKIIFAELPQIPGVLVVYRKPSERSANPERLQLDKRELSHMPLLEGEERLRLLNLQHNLITRVENLVSLPNLIFLDLYNNHIEEINNLHTIATLRVLMLGKNYIKQIKNLQALTKLDVLDLHSNKIGRIENINHLSDLRVLNLANNLIKTVENLQGLDSLTELNLRRNIIDQVNGLNHCPNLQRVFLSNNKIADFQNIPCLKDCAQLSDLTLDGNLIFNKKGYIEFCLKSCQNLKQLDMRKVTPEMRNLSGLNQLSGNDDIMKDGGAAGAEAARSAQDSTQAATSDYMDRIQGVVLMGGANQGTASQPVQGGAGGLTNHTLGTMMMANNAGPASNLNNNSNMNAATAGSQQPNNGAPQGSNQPNTQNNNNNNQQEDISPEGLLQVISQEWQNEMERIKGLGLNGYKRRKESRSECLVQSGHAEIEGDNKLFIYGNALEVLNNLDFQKTVEQISFQYVRFDNIIGPSNISKLKRFQKLKSLFFQDNNIYSFIQISKLEALTSLMSLSIERNEVSDTVLLRTFIVYRFPNVKEINDRAVSDSDKQRARQQFQHFDKILSTPTIFSPVASQSRNQEESKEDRQAAVKNQRMIAKKNAEASQNFIAGLTQYCVSRDQRLEELNNTWENSFQLVINQAIAELSNTQNHINEKVIRQSANL